MTMPKLTELSSATEHYSQVLQTLDNARLKLTPAEYVDFTHRVQTLSHAECENMVHRLSKSYERSPATVQLT